MVNHAFTTIVKFMSYLLQGTLIENRKLCKNFFVKALTELGRLIFQVIRACQVIIDNQSLSECIKKHINEVD